MQYLLKLEVCTVGKRLHEFYHFLSLDVNLHSTVVSVTNNH